jgi:hypothetical protein
LRFVWLGITGRHDDSSFHHQDDGSIRSAGAMHDTFWHHESLLGLQINRSIFEVDDEVSLQDEEKLVVALVFVPMVFALQDPEANHGVIHFAERLVVPRVRTGFHQ